MFRKIENHHFYIEILICFLLFCTISVQGQQTMTATEFLGTAYAEPIVELLQEKIKYQITTDHTLPVIKELEIRAEFDNFDWAEQEYVLRGEFNTKRQRKAQDNFHNTNVDVDNLTQQVEIKKAMTNRYEWLVKWLEVSKNIEGKTKLKSLYQDELIYLKRTVGDVGFDAQDLVKAEEEVLKEGAYTKDTLCVGLARLGQPDQCIVAGTMEELKDVDFGQPLHSFIICGDTHDLEMEVLTQYMVENSKYVLNKSTDNPNK